MTAAEDDITLDITQTREFFNDFKEELKMNRVRLPICREVQRGSIAWSWGKSQRTRINCRDLDGSSYNGEAVKDGEQLFV